MTTATYTYGNALVRKDGEFPLFDGQGSERTVTNSSQTVTGTLTQNGFGNTVASKGSSNPYMYAATSGYRNDGDAGLMHVGARARLQFLVVFVWGANAASRCAYKGIPLVTFLRKTHRRTDHDACQ